MSNDSARGRHRKPGVPSTVRTVSLQVAAVGVVAVPGALVGGQFATSALGSHSTTASETGRLHRPSIDPEAAAYVAGHGTPPVKRAAVKPAAHGAADSTPPVKTAGAVVRPPASAPSRGHLEYTVRSGDSLYSIAERTLGSGARYPEIFRINRHRPEPGGARLTDPSLIEPGWTLVLTAGAHEPAAAGVEAVSQPTKTHEVVSSTPPSASRGTTGGLWTWINEAIAILKAHGYKVSYNAVYETAVHESGGNPTIVNRSDSNAAAGHPSIGLMQMIQSTFDEYALRGYTDIYNPVDNIIAAARYAAANYGSLDAMVAARCGGNCWRGY